MGKLLIKAKTREFAAKLFVYLIMSAMAITMVIPFVWMLSGSLKTETTLFALPFKLIPEHPRWGNYADVWTRVPYGLFYINSAKISVFATIGQLVVCSLGAYALARINFPHRDKIFLLFLATMMIPNQVTMIPQYQLIRLFHLTDTHTALILLRLFSPFGVFMLRQFFLTIPMELSESARIDGCNEFTIYAKIVLPLSKPALATLTVFTFMGAWNDFMGPLIYLNSKERYTLQLGIRYFQQVYGTEYTLVMAATALSLIPVIIVYLFAQRYFIEGVATSGMKG
ncbi:MAG: carbohydrate ABC transporter permease [Spirochaetaceae bacterium]|jgi:multiple sugar transport system permease protein|nr:carbohydrate ABC transporter permease [Spirochaetaceae bacterium]